MLYSDLRTTAHGYGRRRLRLNVLRFGLTDEQRGGEDDTGERCDKLAAVPVDAIAQSARMQRKGYRVVRASIALAGQRCSLQGQSTP